MTYSVGLPLRCQVNSRLAESDREAEDLHATGHRHPVVTVFVHGNQQSEGSDEGNDGQHGGELRVWKSGAARGIRPIDRACASMAIRSAMLPGLEGTS